MAADSARTFLDIDTTTGDIIRRQAITTSAGAGDANKIPAVGADGKFDASFIPDATANVETIQASETIPSQSYVNIHNVSGSRRVRLANAADNTKPANGFVATGVSSGANASVQTGGVAAMSATGFAAGDETKIVFLSSSTSGGGTKTPPSSSGNLVQALGSVIEVSSNVRVQLNFRKLAVL